LDWDTLEENAAKLPFYDDSRAMSGLSRDLPGTFPSLHVEKRPKFRMNLPE
jgi:hypothetical protein